MGKAIESFVMKLKKAQSEEIMKFIETLPVDLIMKPLRGSSEESFVKKGVEMDAYDLADPVEIFNK